MVSALEDNHMPELVWEEVNSEQLRPSAEGVTACWGVVKGVLGACVGYWLCARVH